MIILKKTRNKINDDLEPLILFIASDSYLSCFAGMLLAPFLLPLLHILLLPSLGVHLVGVGEPLELVLVEPLHQPHLHWGQLHRLLRECCVEVAHIHRVFLGEKSE